MGIRRWIGRGLGLGIILTLGLAGKAASPAGERPYRIVDTGQRRVYGERSQLFQAPKPGDAYWGQDGCYTAAPASYRDNNDGTITDQVTGLMWQKTPETDAKIPFADLPAAARNCTTGGHRDWRVPTIKELYSLIDFNGNARAQTPIPYLDTRYFVFHYGDTRLGERSIDCQYWSSTEYLSTTIHGNATVFGVNFADGRIKGYPRDRGRGGGPMKLYLRLVRGNPAYGHNQFVDLHDGTILDQATGLMWSREDSGKGLSWIEALAWCNTLTLAGHRDWRLPTAKELQSIVDYSRAPDARDPVRRGPAIDPLFHLTSPDAWFWSSTTHLEGGRNLGDTAAYVCFGNATGYLRGPSGNLELMDVHGAGAQRSDPKVGDPEQFPRGRGPQGDVVRILNFARAVRTVDPGVLQSATPDLTPAPAMGMPMNQNSPRPGGGEGNGRPSPSFVGQR